MKLGGILLVALMVSGCKKDDGDDPGVDDDNDGYNTEVDCDDDDPAVNPAAIELCNAIDDDCDGNVDDGLIDTFYADDDSDGFGDDGDSIDACERPAGFTGQGGDCDDGSANVFPGNIELCDAIDHNCDGDPLAGAQGGSNWFRDADTDGYGNPSDAQFSCEQPSGYVDDNTDCDDGDSAVSPGAEERCATPYDDDCDGDANELPTADSQAFAIDQDSDSYGDAVLTGEACEPGQLVDVDGDGSFDGVTVDNNTDCDDTEATINPAADELCDGIDNDCNPATTDDDGPEALVWWVDADGDLSGLSTVTVTACEQPVGYVADDLAEDCNDTDPTISPAALELCGDTIDNNCDTLVDDGSAVDAGSYFIDVDSDTFGDAFSPVLSSCEIPDGYVENDFDCDDQDAGIGAPPPVYADNDTDGYGDPALIEYSCVTLAGFVDNADDCDDTNFSINPDTIWFEDGDDDTFGLTGSTLAQCEQPAGYTTVGGDCDDTQASINPGAPDVCDNLDNDCDTDIDEDCTVEHCGIIDADEVWFTDTIHQVTCDVIVRGPGGPVLTIEDGAEVRFAAGARLVVGNTFPGSLQIEDGPVGVEMRSTNLVTPQAWGGVSVGPGALAGSESVLQNLSVYHAGTEGYGIRIDDVPATLDGVLVDGAAGDGIQLLDAASVILRNNAVVDAADVGILASDETDFVEFTNNLITGSGSVPLQLSVSYLDLLDTTSTFAPNGPGGDDPIVLLEGSLDDDATMRLLDADFRVDGDVRVEGGGAPELLVEDGVTVEFSPGTGLVIGQAAQGSLNIEGNGPDAVLFSGTTAIEGSWEGVTIDDQANDSTISGLTILHGGGNGEGNLYLNAQAALAPDERSLMTLVDVDSSLSSTAGLVARRVKLAMADSSFHDNLTHGAQVLDVVFAESDIDNADFDDNSRSGVRISPQLVPLLVGNAFSNNVFPIEITGGMVPESATWQPLDEDFYVTGPVLVEDVDGPILTFQAGTTLYYGQSGRLRVGVGDQGSIIVAGTAPLPVVFTAITEFQGLPSVRGYWEGLDFGVEQRQSAVEYLQVHYAGKTGPRGAVYIEGVHVNPIEFDNLEVRFSGGHGLVSETGPVLFIHDSTFSDGDDIGVILGDGGLQDLGPNTPSFTDNSIENNGLHAMQLFATDVGRVSNTNVINNNNLVTGQPDYLEVTGGVLSQSATWFARNLPYRLSSAIEVGGGANPILTIEAGTRIEFQRGVGAGLTVGGSDLLGGIVAVGTPAQPIVFTSGATFPARGDWRSLEIGEECDAGNGNCILDHVIVEYAGSEPDEGALIVVMREPLFSPTPVVVQNTTVRESGTNGVNIAFYQNIVSPTPVPGIVVPMFCEDLDSNGACDNPLVASDSPDYANGYDHCYDALNQTFGLSNLFCDNNDFNIFARNYTNPYTPRTCGLNDGPVACP